MRLAKKDPRFEPNSAFRKISENLPTSGLKAVFREYCDLMKVDRATGEIWISVSHAQVARLLAARTGDFSKAATSALGWDCNVAFRVINHATNSTDK